MQGGGCVPRRGPQEPSTEGRGDTDGCECPRQHGALREGTCPGFGGGETWVQISGTEGAVAVRSELLGPSSQPPCLAGSELGPAGRILSTLRAKPLAGCGASCPPSDERADALGSEGLSPALHSASELSREAQPPSRGGCRGDGTPDPSVSAHVHHGAQTGTSHARTQPRAVFRGRGRPPGPSCASDALCRAGSGARGQESVRECSKPRRPPLQFQLTLIFI